MAEQESRDLLVEIGTEELPSSELYRLGELFRDGIEHVLGFRNLEFGQTEWFATPRRLAVRVRALQEHQREDIHEHRGPPVSSAFDIDGNPTKAAEGFARKHGVAVDDLERRAVGKAEYLFFVEQRSGQATVELLPMLVATVLRELPAKKRMRWGAPGVTFPRPVHWAVLLYGDDVVETELMGVTSGRHTRGHRFHHPAPIELRRPGDYERLLLDPGHVIAAFGERGERIRAQVEVAAREAGGEADLDARLLEEVTALVEWPVALAGRFDARFLEVPPEALVAVMKDHQRYFPVHDADGALLPAFVTVSNIDSTEPGTVRAGNERVIAPRFADAEFFWNQDRRRPLAERLDGLRAMVFQRRLGTLYDRAKRIATGAGRIAQTLGADPQAAREAGRLAKCDLLTAMVGEFPELQGIMGGYYAREEGYPEAVARAITDHYRPAFAGDALPQSSEGAAVALADRLDALVGIFAIGQAPTGDSDPFALRRAALGALRIVIEGGLELDLEKALTAAARQHDPDLDAKAAVPKVFEFMMDRLRVYYTDRGYAPDVFEAVLARRPTRPVDFDARLRALHDFSIRPEAGSLAEANKRIQNILRKAEFKGGARPYRKLTENAAERNLLDYIKNLDAETKSLVKNRDYEAALARLAELADPLDDFFDGVMVMSDKTNLRENRIALLNRARDLFLRIADISRLGSVIARPGSGRNSMKHKATRQ